MPQSERSKRAQAQAGWVNYQIHFLHVDADEAARRPMPDQFRDIFLVGFALGEERGRKNAVKS